MRFGFVLPGGTAAEQVEQAVLADEAGWDGIFVWESHVGVDAWTLLAAIAMRTRTVRLGTMLTALPWRRPWKLACQVATLDQLSGGRAILTVGLGAIDPALGRVGEERDRRIRAARLDAGLDIVTGLWRGERRFIGEHYDVDLSAVSYLDPALTPVQQPRPPIWVVGAWPRPRSMRRVLRCDGIVPATMTDRGFRETTPQDVRDIRDWLAKHQEARSDFDIVVEGETPSDTAQAGAIVEPWATAGATWWLDARWSLGGGEGERQIRERLAAGPPTLA